jgi:hypothetical protein
MDLRIDQRHRLRHLQVAIAAREKENWCNCTYQLRDAELETVSIELLICLCVSDVSGVQINFLFFCKVSRSFIFFARIHCSIWSSEFLFCLSFDLKWFSRSAKKSKKLICTTPAYLPLKVIKTTKYKFVRDILTNTGISLALIVARALKLKNLHCTCESNVNPILILRRRKYESRLNHCIGKIGNVSNSADIQHPYNAVCFSSENVSANMIERSRINFRYRN